MYFDPDNDLNEETADAIKTLADTLLYGEGGTLEEAAGIWVARKMLFAPAETVDISGEGEDDGGYSLTDTGYDIETVESVEDFLNEGDADKNWKEIETLSVDKQKQWVTSVLKEIINGEHDVDTGVRGYISKIPDQDNLAAYIEARLDSFGSRRKAWLDDFIQQSIMVMIMQYRDAASETQASFQQREHEEQKHRQIADDASIKVMRACDAQGGMQTFYGIDECDDILDLLEGIVDGEDITENDVAHFVRVNSARFDEDVMYLLGTRFPILDEGD